MVDLKKNEEQLTSEVMGKISLSKDKVNLEKHVVNLSKTVVDLSKKNDVDLGSTRAKVVVALDYSCSMDSLYKNGTVQETLNRLVPLGLTFDDNGSIDVYLFETGYRKFDDLTIENYETYVKDVIDKSGYSMGCTNYAGVLNDIIFGGTHKETVQKRGLFGFGKKSVTKEVRGDAIVSDDQPTFIIFITDGENMDEYETNDVIRKASKENVFIQFIGIGDEKFKYLKKLDELDGRERDNTGFVKLKKLKKASDEELYTSVLEQFAAWLKNEQ